MPSATPHQPWTEASCPEAIARLPEPTREKALEEGNRALASGADPERALRLALELAAAWTSERTREPDAVDTEALKRAERTESAPDEARQHREQRR